MNKICASFISVLRSSSSEKFYTSSVILGRRLSFKSDLSLEKLYPNSRLKLYTPPPPTNTGDKFSGFIPINQLEITYSRSSGPGGQHVNCVNTKVDLRFKLVNAEWIPEKTRQKLVEGLQNKLTKDGYFVIKSDLTRSQQMNLADALEKLRNLIREYEVEKAVPTEETLEKLRRRQEKAARERLLVKRQRSLTKSTRQGPSITDL
ncbi:PREDICTED: peptidyl-tRNA hydrolase ICT1, mitochondrial [Rhagoletis zephyria]|uniref:peptidyl-tRNA hydrolase ICT1, mitochondrial n=1 Tax=Rhagoletis zephyria TaxID=28612 RepID=UPI000811479F|nr:PREDICTED: peptidyl-tRNA hydrolase ICT1, mitochondrial [Rhagoletis zephyria]